MKQLLIRADDLGYSYAVNLGIARAVSEGLPGYKRCFWTVACEILSQQR